MHCNRVTYEFQSTRPIRGATPGPILQRRDFNPRAPYGARLQGGQLFQGRVGISIHAPHTGRDSSIPVDAPPPPAFQSTRPMRGATENQHYAGCGPGHFNPRAPCGARPCGQLCTPACPPFQSTRPMRGATYTRDIKVPEAGISIHAPHAGRDPACRTCRWGSP